MPALFPYDISHTPPNKWWTRVHTCAKWLGLAACVIASSVTSYTVATLFILSCLALPISTVNAVLAANLVSCIALACSIVWAFGARTPIPLWAALLLAGMFLGSFVAITSYATIHFALSHR